MAIPSKAVAKGPCLVSGTPEALQGWPEAAWFGNSRSKPASRPSLSAPQGGFLALQLRPSCAAVA